MKNILVLWQSDYERVFKKKGVDVQTLKHLEDLTNGKRGYSALPDLIVFTGGADISPHLYGEERHPFTSSHPERDKRDIYVYEWAKMNEIPCVGICRGGQFLNVMNGGSLHQHVENHGRSAGHMIDTHDGETNIIVTSTHHQMMIVADGGELLAWAEDVAFGGVKEPEVVWYQDSQDLCVQYHPEYMNEESEGYRYFIRLIEEYFDEIPNYA